ncbi:MAG: serine--tRNA ligase [Patescibacteria group bacterium]|nr:serine--tRNA ligase [Patescibacteria group bacterium]
MLDINFIKENKDKVIKAVKDKQLDGTVDIEVLVRLHDSYLEVLREVESLRSQRNTISEKVAKAPKEERGGLIGEATKVKENLQEKEKELGNLQVKFDEMMLWVPNVPADDVPIGKDETGNVVYKKEGKLPKFNFTPKDHLELGKDLDIIDTDRGVKIAGFRGYFLKNEGAILEQAILRYAFDFMQRQGFTPLSVPWIVNPAFFTGTGYFPWGEEDHYKVDDKALIGTAEVSLTSYYAGETLNEDDLPVRLVAISPCFRREVGTYGQDAKGVFRLHQFYKVEQVVLCEADEDVSRRWHEKMLSFSEKVVRDFKLPYQVLLMCTGDVGAGQRKKYDIETWFPSQQKYRETHSDSYFLDFQSRRLNIKYKTKEGETKFVHTLNNTVIATPRIIAAIIENYQNADGSITIPKALRKYTGFNKIKPKNR